MRYSSAVGIGLGLVVVLPALAAPQQQKDLEHALSETVRALAVLTGIEKDLHTRPAEQAIELARSATEPAFGDERSRDEQLQMLRKDVGRLQMAWDEVAGGKDDAAAVDGAAVAMPGEAAPLPSVTITTGMDDRMRAQLSGETLTPLVRRNDTSPLPRGNGSTAPASAVRDDAADALRQGQALLRANKAKDALVVLRPIENDVRAKYWIARSLEKLERIEEALDLYRAVAASPDAGYLAARATNDADFLEWKRDFAKKLDKNASTTGASSKTAPAKTDESAAPKTPAAKDDSKSGATKSAAGKTKEGA